MVSTSSKSSQNSGQSFWKRSANARPTDGIQNKNQNQARLISQSNRNPVPILKNQPMSSGATTSAVSSPVSSNSSKPPGAAVSKEGETRKPDHPILFQTYFKSVGPRTYAAQVKRATNGNQYLVITEGRRDKNSDQIRKNYLNIFSEDFEAFFNLLRDTTRWLKDHPLPPEFQAKRRNMWQKISAKENKVSPKVNPD